ncbi:ABC-three component system protein [Acetobacterium carbinolicum]|uniref:ABC-three component system protein n=1 Tax=Acetobacterium carbinolicum TaxID=52690 RepID=UPI003BF4E113
MSGTVTDYRNATASWSGYSHQGKVGLMLTLKEICKLLDDGNHFDGWSVEYESAEDIDIKNDDSVVSRHQVKAYIDGNTLKAYEDVLLVQKCTLVDDKQKISKGFQIRSFDIHGKPLEIEVDEESRFLHTICEVPGFYFSKADYEKQKYKPIFVENQNNIKLYKYPDGKEYCNVNDNSCKIFCIEFIKYILEKDDHAFKEISQQHEHIYLELLDELDSKIHREHSIGGCPRIDFSKILHIVLDTREHERQNALILRSIFIEKFEEFLNERNLCDISYTDKAISNAWEKVKEIYNLTDDEFFRLLCELNPEKKIASLSSTEAVIEICNPTDIKNMFFDCLLEVQDEEFVVKERSYMKNGGYLLTLITDPQLSVSNTVNQIITNKNLTKCVFEKKYMLNREIDDLEWESHIGNLSDKERFYQEIKSNWSTLKVEKKFYEPELTFMTYKNAKGILKGDNKE